MRALAMTGTVTAAWMASMRAGSLMRATPPSRRMSAGTRSRAITATAPASSAILACSAVTTSMMTPPRNISARPLLTRLVPVTRSGVGLGTGVASGIGPSLPVRQSGTSGIGRTAGRLCLLHVEGGAHGSEHHPRRARHQPDGLAGGVGVMGDVAHRGLGPGPLHHLALAKDDGATAAHDHGPVHRYAHGVDLPAVPVGHVLQDHVGDAQHDQALHH